MDKMKQIYKYILLFLIFFSFANASENRQTLITEIKINNNKIALKDSNDIVLSTTDSINVSYGCKTTDTENDKWLFRIKLKKGEDESTTNVQSAQLIYKNLQEGEYLIIIEAFRSTKWTASKAFLKFKVNNQEAEIRRKAEELKRESARQDSIKNAEANAKNAGAFSKYMLFIIIGVVITIIITLTIVILIFKKSKSSNNKSKKMNMEANNNNFDNRSKEEIVEENASLRAEIAALREQIDAMQSRGSELNEKNKELEDKVSRVSDSKKELEDLQKQKDELFAMIIHDIKNPASLIKGLVELLRSYDLNAVETQEIIDDIVETTEKIVSLSQEVSKILTLESSSFNLSIEQGQLSEVISSVYRRNLSAAQIKSIQMFLEINDNLPEAMFDAQRIEEVMDNLVSNAVKFSHKGGTVRIRAYSVENNIVVETSDNGLGLSEDDIKKAFMRGAKLSARPTAGESSSGLGLWIVKKIVDAHKGRVWVRSALGKGSTFSFSIPLTQPQSLN